MNKFIILIMMFSHFSFAGKCKEDGVKNCEEETTRCYTYLKYSYERCLKWSDRCMEVVKIKCESDSDVLQEMEIIAE